METNVLTIEGDENLIYETGITSSQILYNDSVYHPRENISMSGANNQMVTINWMLTSGTRTNNRH